MTHNYSSIFAKLNAAFSISIYYYKDNCLVHSWTQHDFTVPISSHYMYPYICGDYPLCFVISPESLLSGYLSLDNPGEYLIIGPALSYDLNADQIDKILHGLGLTDHDLKDFLRYTHFLPKLSSVNFQNVLSLLYELIFPDKEEIPVHLTFQAYSFPLSSKSDLELKPDTNSLIEQKLLTYVSLGMTEEVKSELAAVFASTDLYLPALAFSDIRALKNSLIASTTIIARTALESGLDYQTAVTLSDYYILKIEKLSSASELLETMHIMILDFTKRISLFLQPDSGSAIVSSVYRDVQKHKYEKLTSSDIAKHLSFSTGYLCHHFKEKTGMTLTDYIHRQKVQEAKYLLKTTNLSLSSISEKLCFSSQQQFQTVFRKVVGMTPKQYKISDRPLSL